MIVEFYFAGCREKRFSSRFVYLIAERFQSHIAYIASMNKMYKRLVKNLKTTILVPELPAPYIGTPR